MNKNRNEKEQLLKGNGRKEEPLSTRNREEGRKRRADK